MLKKFSFWIVLVLVAAIGSTVFIHWKALQGLHQRTARIYPLYQRQKIIDSLMLSLERYRRMSTSFRKLSSDELSDVKSKLKTTFSEGISQLDQLDPTSDERAEEHLLGEQLSELMKVSAHFEPLLFTKDAYIKPEVQDLHESVLATLSKLGKSVNVRMDRLRSDSSQSESQSVVLLFGVGGFILFAVLCMIVRNQIIHFRPLKKLHQYANELKAGKSVPQNPPHFDGVYGEIQTTLNQLALGVETHMRDRHKFILDIVEDLKSPLSMLQAGKYLISNSGGSGSEEQQAQSAESVRRGLAIFSGSLDDLNDIVDINRLEARLEEKTVDLSELLSDVARTVMGSDMGKRVSIIVPPIPVWALIDPRRFERVMVHVLTKVVGTLPQDGNLTISVTQPTQGSFRGVEILVQDTERLKSGRPGVGGPEQDIIKHWISENGLSMALTHKIVKAHNGSISAAGIAGTSVTIAIRLPQERVVSRGLIAPPTQAQESPPSLGLKSLVAQQKQTYETQGSII